MSNASATISHDLRGAHELAHFFAPALALWILMLWMFGLTLLKSRDEPRLGMEAVEARFIELPSSPGEAAPQLQPRLTQEPGRRPVAPSRAKPVPLPREADSTVVGQPPEPARVSVPTQLREASATTELAQAPEPFSTGSRVPLDRDRIGARAIYCPLPSIPDKLREEALTAVALARFHIAPDGNAMVELVTPTVNPLLNQILLGALKTWRFSPAIENNKPVASNQDVRIRFDVK